MTKNDQPIFTLNKRENDPTSKIDVIKDLIFGENIKEYDQEFEKLKKDILGKKKELESLVEEVRIDLESAISDLSTDVNIRITELEDKLEDKIEVLEAKKVSKDMIGKLFLEMGEKFTKK